jgi:hypothetical protein
MLCGYHMTFLNPLVLLGLAAAAIPVLIHLLSRRKLRTVDFSSLRFLKELQQTSIRRLKIRQLLLLILRILLIAALVMAFARPVLHGPLAGTLGNQSANSIVILLDDSPSMAVRSEKGELFAQARETASAILSLARENDGVTLATLSGTSRTDTLGPPEPPSATRTTLQHLGLSKTSVPLFTALKKALHTLSLTPTANREIYVVTDGQASQCAIPETPGDSVTPGPGTPQVFMLTLPAGTQDNTGISSVEILSNILSTGRPVMMHATLRNAGNRMLKGSMISIYLDGARVAQHAVDIPPLTSVVIQFSVVPKRPGILTGYCALEDDALDADNRAHFVLMIPPRIRVALSGPSPAETRYAYLALTLSGDTSLTGPLSVVRIDGEKLLTTDIESYDAIVLCGIREFSPPLAERLAAYVKNGKGLVVFPGEGMNARTYNETLANKLGLPLLPPMDPKQSPRNSGGTTAFLSFGKIDYAHPLFSGLFESAAGRQGTGSRIESPEIKRTVGITNAGDGTVIIELGNGEPFLAEYRRGNGRVLLYTVEALPGWSNFPLKGIFAPLLHRSLLYVASGDLSNRRFTAGERLRLSVRRTSLSGQSSAVVFAPSGLEERVAPRYRASTGTISFETAPASETGIYLLRPADRSGKQDPLEAAAVDIAPTETDLHPAQREDLSRLWNRLGIPEQRVISLASTEGLERAIQESRYGMELWKYFAGLAFLLAIVEMLVARNWSQTGEPDQEGARR